ncbi:MAG: phage major capsid protein [Microbacterium gubbeenense]|uniref:phage major capsid protein n=1 Tax=Microbacterium gubbeenense TaxID=159896 RepID=UPI003F99503E
MANLLENYKNQFTLDGALKPQAGASKEKVKYLKGVYEKAKAGDRMADAQLAELFTSTDAGFSMAHLINIQTIPQLPKEEEENLQGLAGQRTVKDFNPVVLRSLIASAGVQGAGLDQHGAASVVPEGTNYPMVTMTEGHESFYSKLSKRGLRFDWTWESFINDATGTIQDMPGELVDVYGKSVNAEIFDALGQAAKFLEGGIELPDGTSTVANAKLSAEGLLAAAIAYENRKINGNKLGDAGSYNVVIPKGRKRFLEYDLAQFGRIVSVQDGAFTLLPDTAKQELMPNIKIVESDRVQGSEWYFLPTPGSTSRPVLEQLKLRGHESPEIRYRNDQGFHPGGGQVGLFQGGYDADSASMRLRIVTGGVLWDDTYVVRSKGTGQA